MKTCHRLLGLALLAAASTATALAAPTGEPYRIGYISDITGPVQGTFKYTYDGFKLFADHINAEGGINGRPLEVVLKDVQSDTQKSVNAVHELQAAKVSGIAGLAVSSTHAATHTAAAKVGLPIVVGFPPNLPIVLEPADRYAFGAGQVFNVTNTITGTIARNLRPQAKRIACVAFEAPASIYSCNTALESARKAGFDAAEIFIVPQNQRDYRPVATSLSKFKPDIIIDCLGQSHVIGLLPALGASGYRGTYLNLETGIGDPVKREGVKHAPGISLYSYTRYIGGRNIAVEGPQAAKLQAAANKAGIKEILAAHSSGWVLGQVVAQAFEKCKDDCSPEAFRAALETTDVDPGGLTGAHVKYTATDHYGPTAYRLYEYDRQSTDFKPVSDWYQLAPGKQADK